MKRVSLLAPLFTLAAVAAAALSSFAAEPTAQSIFDGRTLAGWEGNTRIWRIENGAITGEILTGQSLPQNELLYFKDEVADFELTFEFRLTGAATANSGIQFRSKRKPDGQAVGYQADLDLGEVWLGRIHEEGGRGLLVERGTRVSIAPDGRRWSEEFAPAASFKNLPRPGVVEWNTYRIVVTGTHTEVWINDRRVSVLDDHDTKSAAYSGRIALELQGGRGPVRIQFRNIRLAQLGRTAPPSSAPAATPPPAATADTPPTKAAANTSIGAARRNGDPPLRRTAEVDDFTRLNESPVLWHLRHNPAKPTAIANAAAQKLVAGLKLVDGFKAELIAAEPDLQQPVAMAFDERGRIWIAEAFNYPNKQPEGKGKDRILIFEDKDGDGAFETRKVFAENLNLVSGLEVGFGGVWVGAAPQLLFIPDKNHDDVPDAAPVVLLDGWGFQDTHETLNSFTWGPDGWLYGCQGVFVQSQIGKPGAPAEQRKAMRAGVWRYHPVRHEFEIFAHGGSNQWGLDFNSVGALFMTHCRSFHGGGGTTYVVRNGHYWNQANANHAAFISNRAPDFAPDLKNFLLASARYDSGEGGAGKPGTTAVYGGHSHVGTMLYLGDNWPDIYRDHLFTHNLHGHQINHQHNVRRGSGYETFHAGSDLLFAPDATYMAVDLQYGPDGAVYVIDWSDTQHCHNPNDELWDRSNGRLYRVAWAATHTPRKIDLAAMQDGELAALHTHRNEWFARTARRVLQERAATRAIDAAALAVLRQQSTDSAADVPTQLRALWTLHALNALDATALKTALAHSSDVVRAWAVQLGTERAPALALTGADLMPLAQQDPSPAVRLAVASAIPALPLADRWPLIAALAAHPEDAADRYLPKMVWFALGPLLQSELPRTLELASTTPLPTLADSIHWLAARSREGREKICDNIATLPRAAAMRTLRVLAFALDTETGIPMPIAWSRVTGRFPDTAASDGVEPAARLAVEQLSALFRDKTVLARNRARLTDPTTPPAERRLALDLLKRAGDRESTAPFVRLLADPELRSAVIPLLANAADTNAVANGLITNFSAFNAAERNAALGVLAGKPALALALLRAVESGAFEKKNLTALHARQLRNLKNAEVNTLLDRVWGRTTESSADAKATIARLRTTFREAPTWAYELKAGRAVYDRLCAACHTMEGSGGKLGPDLTGTWRNGLDYFLENIVDPNAVVGADFQLHLITKRDGAVVSGMFDKETDTSITLRTAADPVSVAKADILRREVTPQSLMPPGLLEALPQREAVELLNFLTAERR